jgi:hypothetical protein
LLLQTSQNDMSFKNTDMEITQKNVHKKDSWHSCDIRRSVAHNYNKNLCEKNYEKKKNLTKTNIGTIVIAKFHKMTKISYYRICTMRYNILHFQSPTSGYALHVCDTIYYTVN